MAGVSIYGILETSELKTSGQGAMLQVFRSWSGISDLVFQLMEICNQGQGMRKVSLKSKEKRHIKIRLKWKCVSEVCRIAGDAVRTNQL